MKYRKTLLAAVLTVPLALTACGSDEGTADDSTATSSAPEQSASNTDGDAPKPEEGQPALEGQPGEPAPEGENPPPPAPPQDPNAPQDPQTAPPVPAHEGTDQQQIESLVNGMNVGDNMPARFHYVADNYCAAYLDPRGGADGFRAQADSFMVDGKPVTISETGQEIPTVNGVTNVQVNGDNATGDIQSSQGSYPMQFTREGGTWKICPTS